MNETRGDAETLPATDIEDQVDPSARLSILFEKAWDRVPIGGEPPRIEAFLEDAPTEVRDRLRAMLSDIDRRRRGRTEAMTDGAATIGLTIEPDAGAIETLPLLGTSIPPRNDRGVDPGATAAFSGADLEKTIDATLDRTQPPRTRVGDGLETNVEIFVATPSAKPARFKMFQMGGYEILDELGRGGMGVVYKARQIRLDRIVALKMVLGGGHASGEQLARFQIEAQAVAQLQHPGIVQIYEVGEHDELPYFSLEFVEGPTLAKRIGGKPTKPGEAAVMVRAIALAMSAAHSRGIIHRDLKPANILLTLDGKPKITDFGLAKRLEGDSGQTRSGAVMGTPSYMAPEQAWGKTQEVGPHSDQYAVGAILYEMLTGRPPFQGASILETLELARTQEPVPPSQLQPSVPADLETICLKALQKEPRKRYESVGTLAEDLDRFLRGEPILARPVSTYERAWRWCARNKKIAALLAAVAVLMIAVTTVSTVAAVSLDNKNRELDKSNIAERKAREDAVRNEQLAIAAKEKERKARDLAEKNEQTAIAAKNAAVAANARAKIQTGKTLESLRYLSVLAYQRLREVPGTEDLRAELIKTATEGLRSNMDVMEQLGGASTLGDDKNAELEMRSLAGLNQRAGRVMDEVGKHDEAERYFKKMDELADQLAARNPKAIEPKKVKAASLNTLGDFYLLRKGDARGALRFHEQALEFRRQWAAEESRNDEAKRGVANTLGAVARDWLTLGDPFKARDLYREEIAIRDQFSHDFGSQLEVRRERTGLLEKIGDLCVALGDTEEARKSLEESLKARRELAVDNPDSYPIRRDVQLSSRKLGMLKLIQDKDPVAARALFEQELTVFQKDLDAAPTSILAKQDVASAHYDVALAALRQNDRATADEHFAACLALREKLHAVSKTKVSAMELMFPLARRGKYREAAEIADDLIKTPPQDTQVYFAAGCGYALCAGAVQKLDESAEMKAIERKFVESCFRSLRLALARGWKEVVAVETDPDLDAVRTDPGFASLLKEFQEASKR